jgi:hypothetical protein
LWDAVIHRFEVYRTALQFFDDAVFLLHELQKEAADA